MSRASEDQFDLLHRLVVENLTNEIKAYTQRGEPIPPALLAQAIKMLKENGIDSPARAQNIVDTLAPHMPDFDETDLNDRVPH
jgi:hypothetical protein